jgi:hypothetical protein
MRKRRDTTWRTFKTIAMHSCTTTSAAVGGMRKEFENKEVNSLAAQHQEAGACSKQQEAQWSPGPPVGSAPRKNH